MPEFATLCDKKLIMREENHSLRPHPIHQDTAHFVYPAFTLFPS